MPMPASGLVEETGKVLSNEHLARNLYLMEVESPRIADALQPGQFVHMRLPGMEGHILRRPFSVFDVNLGRASVEILYQAVGFGTSHMTGIEPGACVSSIGPVGNGWHAPAGCRRALLVGGGVGAAPLFLHAKRLVAEGVEVDVVLGAQTAQAMVCAGRYERVLGKPAVMATDDGTLGHAGFCTGPAKELLQAADYDHVACCGPEPLMRIVADMAANAQVECQVSLERRMACGVGACLSCVVDTKEGKKRCCVDGPVFQAEEVMWR